MGTLNVTEVCPQADWVRIRTGISADDSGAIALTECLMCQGPFVDFLVRGDWNSETIAVEVYESTSTPTGAVASTKVLNGFVDGSTTKTLSANSILPQCKGRGYVTLYFSADGGVTSLDVWARPS